MTNLTRALAERGVECSIIATRGRLTGVTPASAPGADVRLFSTDLLAYAWVAHAPDLWPAMQRAARQADLVHIHELWHFPHWAAYRAARRWGVPYVVTPHGQLAPWMLSQKAWRKRVYGALLLRPSLRHAAAVQALSPREAGEFRAFGVTATVYQVPNGVDAPDVDAATLRNLFWERFPGLHDKRIVLFLGRIQRQKGIDTLVDAFPSVRQQSPTACLVIVGPDDAGLQEQLVARARALGVGGSVLFAGPLFGVDRHAALAAADVFVLPSRAEGQSVALLEAMAAGVPTVVTPEANAPDVRRSNAGLVVPHSPSELASALVRVLHDGALARTLGRNGRATVLTWFTWDKVADQVTTMYQRVIASSPPRPRVCGWSAACASTGPKPDAAGLAPPHGARARRHRHDGR